MFVSNAAIFSIIEEKSENELSGEENEDWLCCTAREPHRRRMAAQKEDPPDGERNLDTKLPAT